MRRKVGATRLDRPWHRPGAVRYALRRLPGLLFPLVSVYEAPEGSVSVLRDLPVVVRDGTTLRVNVVLPAGGGRFPVLMSAHPYGKDNLPRRRGRGWRVSFLYRILRQTGRVRFSSLTGWEAADPAWWAAQGYAVASCDLRGAGTSQGEARDGVVSAIEQAKHVAGDKVVGLHGATVMQQALPLDLVDQIRVHVIPVLLGAGTPLFGTLASPITLERTHAVITPAATHMGFSVIR